MIKGLQGSKVAYSGTSGSTIRHTFMFDDGEVSIELKDAMSRSEFAALLRQIADRVGGREMIDRAVMTRPLEVIGASMGYSTIRIARIATTAFPDLVPGGWRLVEFGQAVVTDYQGWLNSVPKVASPIGPEQQLVSAELGLVPKGS